jgi:hypothetical protein
LRPTRIASPSGPDGIVDSSGTLSGQVLTVDRGTTFFDNLMRHPSDHPAKIVAL